MVYLYVTTISSFITMAPREIINFNFLSYIPMFLWPEKPTSGAQNRLKLGVYVLRNNSPNKDELMSQSQLLCPSVEQFSGVFYTDS